ncbi:MULTISPECIES: hypothetical protein [unclassified Aeromicrobium]|nr:MULTISPECIES: hypothetical protein [unclassified Aeromicrobium]
MDDIEPLAFYCYALRVAAWTITASVLLVALVAPHVPYTLTYP